MKAINLYILAEMKNMKLYGKYYASLTGEKERAYKPHEAQSLSRLVSVMMQRGAKVEEFDNFFYGYIIPRIGKEFDILKIGENAILNIELKSWVGNENAVLDQLIKNKFYLAHLNKTQYFYTFNSNTDTLYKLDENNLLKVCDIDELINVNKSISGAIDSLIDDLFKVSNFIVSPNERPERFILGEYFLTQQQQQIKKQTLNSLQSGKNVKIAGAPGTGKTLLLYDIAVNLAKKGTTVFLQKGNITKAQLEISRKFGFDFITCKDYCQKPLYCDYLLIDESERLDEKDFNSILYAIKNKKIKALFAFEKNDVSVGRTLSSIRMSKIRGVTFTLSGRIRINFNLNLFIRALFDGSRVVKRQNNNCNLTILGTNGKKHTQTLIDYMNAKEYKRICVDNNLKPCEKNREDLPLNESYGKEFDFVTVVIDGNYYLNENNQLCDKRTNAFAEDLYYAITRVREGLCLIIENNEKILLRALEIKCLING